MESVKSSTPSIKQARTISGNTGTKNTLKKPLKDKDLLSKKLKPESDYKLDIKKPTTSISSLPTPSLPDIAISSQTKEVVSRPKEKSSVEKVTEKKVEFLSRRPNIFFIKGLESFSFTVSTSSGSYDGIERMADALPGSRVYGWDQKDEMIKEIKKSAPEAPVILVGHSLGGDTAIEIAEELNTLEHGFRNVEYLVSLDAFGSDHDIIPQNVKEHLNIFGETSYFLNDGPHVARRHDKTQVTNILSSLDHTDIDDSKEVQFDIVETIQKLLSKPVDLKA